MEVINAYPPAGERLRDVERVRSTLITAGIANLRALGLLDAWAKGVDPQVRDELLTSIAGTWLPVELALKYYRGCDALQLSYDQAVAIGRGFAARVGTTVLHTVKRVATGVGVTPWTYAGQFDRFWTRAMDGGGFRIVKVGPKDATIEVLRVAMADSPYFRAAFCGIHLAVLDVVARAVSIRVATVARSKDAFTVRAAWV